MIATMAARGLAGQELTQPFTGDGNCTDTMTVSACNQLLEVSSLPRQLQLQRSTARTVDNGCGGECALPKDDKCCLTAPWLMPLLHSTCMTYTLSLHGVFLCQ